jgi:hypothetical protein
MYVYDALSKVRSDIEKRKRNQDIKVALKAGGLGLIASVIGVIVWFLFILTWAWVWM